MVFPWSGNSVGNFFPPEKSLIADPHGYRGFAINQGIGNQQGICRESSSASLFRAMFQPPKMDKECLHNHTSVLPRKSARRQTNKRIGLALQIDNSPSHRDGDRLRAIICAEFLHDVLHVNFHGFHSDEEPFGDVLIPIAFRCKA